MWKGMLAVFAGYVGMVVVVISTQAVIVKLFLPATNPHQLTTPYVAANLSCAFVGAVLAGCICSTLSPRPRTRYVAILAAVVLALSLVSAVTDQAHPSWYFVVIGLLGGTGAFLGHSVVSGS
jgi:hypothetical protein